MTCSHQYSDDKIEKNEIGGHVICVGARRDGCRVLVGKSGVKRQIGRLRPRWIILN